MANKFSVRFKEGITVIKINDAPQVNELKPKRLCLSYVMHMGQRLVLRQITNRQKQ